MAGLNRAINAGSTFCGAQVRRQGLWLVMMTNLNYVYIVKNYYFK